MNESTFAGGGSYQENLNDLSQKASDLSEKASEGVKRVKASVRDATGSAREALTEGGREALAEGSRAAGQAADLVRDQPLIAMAITGAACLALGMLLGRR